MGLEIEPQLETITEKLRHKWRLLFNYEDCPFGTEFQEAWNHRYELFSRFDQGIQTDAIGLYSVTPDKTAKQIAEPVTGETVVDAFCGIGGNAIAFGAVCSKVIAIDIDEARLNMAKHNAAVYDRTNIEFMVGNFLQLAPTLKADTVFLDPPWGGPQYINKREFTLADFSPDGRTLLDIAFQYFSKVILRVPANFRMAELDLIDKTFGTQDNFIHGQLISKTIYFN